MTTSESRRLSRDQHWIDRLPLFVALCVIFALAMLVPAAFAGLTEDYDSGRPFLYGGLVFLAISTLIGIAAQTRPKENENRTFLLSLLAAFLVMPLILALPVMEAVPDLSFRNAYFEMVSSTHHDWRDSVRPCRIGRRPPCICGARWWPGGGLLMLGCRHLDPGRRCVWGALRSC